jgi:hypothetical protein
VTHPEGIRPAGGHPRRLALKRVTLSCATALIAVNIWTGCPLVALWVGSKAVGGQILSMGAVGVVIVVLAVLMYAMAALLVRLNNAYDDLTGRGHTEERAAWLKSMRGEDKRDTRGRSGITALERIVISTVYLAAIALTIWFLFYSGIPLMNPSNAH